MLKIICDEKLNKHLSWSPNKSIEQVMASLEIFHSNSIMMNY